MADLATVRERAPMAAEPIGEAGALISMIERAVRDPSVDMDKMERLFAMHERATARSAEVAYADAMSAAQAELGPVAADANNPQTRSRYASYAALDRAVRPIYVRHGFALSFGTAEGAPPDHIRLTCKVTHRAGHAEAFHVDMPADGKGAKGGDVMTKTHAAGAAMSYGQRYLLKLIFNIAVGDDVDGNTPTAREMGAAAQAAMAAINTAESLQALQSWKAKNAAGLDRMGDGERREIISLYSRRQTTLKGGAS